MWGTGWRDQLWSELDQDWDIIIIGGGITGAGVLREAVQKRLKVLLVDANDFSYGASSKSSKMVHGGFRYMKNRQFDVTREAVREREWMLREAPNLVTSLGFLVPAYKAARGVRWEFAAGLIIYDLMAPKWAHHSFDTQQLLRICPLLNPTNLSGGFLYYDAQMDDSRLVLRLLKEAVSAGGTALNYASVDALLRDHAGKVCGVRIRDTSGLHSRDAECKARVVINAAGPWSDQIRNQITAPPRLRKLRGSHLVFRNADFPLQQAVTLAHPFDHRAMFALPWEGVTVIGTTDLDHQSPLSEEVFASEQEIEYILQALTATFPSLGLGREHIISSFSGLRPIINTGKANPSQESRAHVVWDEQGLITITGGKLTTFRIMASEALQKASIYLPGSLEFKLRPPIFNPAPCGIPVQGIDPFTETHLTGRYGCEVMDFIKSVAPDELKPIAALPNLWAELRWAARCEGVIHLDDLLLRRVRLGLLLPGGGFTWMGQIKAIVQQELGWDDPFWQTEENRYRQIWLSSFSPSPEGTRLQTVRP